ncbi:MAG: hypothetical protein PUK40_06890 [Actinomycetaceae bacterium]|nr:hypothetical protein [Arcanobacterium sp.]MDD7505647.1 hypothetical protein [Actinomycetaceae bacterium]MDY6143431.1 hypothetical protein [Arcanobacterium sp.]
MSTPTDPYNSGNAHGFDDDDLLAPITPEGDAPANGGAPTSTNETSETAHDDANVSYGTGEELAWDSAFTEQLAESAAEAADGDPIDPGETATGIEHASDASSADPFASAAYNDIDGDELTIGSEDLTFPDTSDSSVDARNTSAGSPSTANDETVQFAPANSYEHANHNRFTNDAGFNELPPEERENASLTDVVSAHSADEAPYGATATYSTNSMSRPVEEGESFASAYSSTGQLPAIDADPYAGNSSDAPAAVVPAAPPTASVDSAPQHSAAAPKDLHFEEVPDKPKSRVGAHIGSIFATLVLIPLAWYLISDAGVRLSVVDGNPWLTGKPNWFAIVELFGGFVALLLLWLMARASSLGAQIFGAILTLAGLVAVFSPLTGNRVVNIVDNEIGSFNAFTSSVVHHLNLDLASGRIAVFGVIIFLTGFMIHLARKSAGRRSEALTKRELLG